MQATTRAVEALKIDANEALRRRQAELGLPDGERLPFFCECDDPPCRAIVRLTGDEYRLVRAAVGRYVVIEGHPYDGRIVARGEGYLLAEGGS